MVLGCDDERRHADLSAGCLRLFPGGLGPEDDPIELLFGVLEPAEKIRKPHDTRGVGVGPMDFLADLEECAHLDS